MRAHGVRARSYGGLHRGLEKAESGAEQTREEQGQGRRQGRQGQGQMRQKVTSPLTSCRALCAATSDSDLVDFSTGYPKIMYNGCAKLFESQG